MYRGTTPTITVALGNVSTDDLGSIYVTFRQGNRIVTKRNGESGVTVTENGITVVLSQQDTLTFEEGDKIQMQVRAVCHDGTAIASDITKISIKDVLLDGEIT